MWRGLLTGTWFVHTCAWAHGSMGMYMCPGEEPEGAEMSVQWCVRV